MHFVPAAGLLKAAPVLNRALFRYRQTCLLIGLRVMASRAVLDEFAFDHPKDWFLRMEASLSLLEASTGKTINKKVYLLATMGSKASTLLADLLSPKVVSSAAVTYDDMKTSLLDHLRSQRLEIAERALFYATTQNPSEASSDFFSRLKKQAEYCNFGVSLNDMLRDRLVLGCRSIEARKRLLQMEPLTLKTVQDTLLMFEAVESARANVLQTGSSIDNVRTTRQYKPKPTGSASKPFANSDGKPCARCGKSRCPGKRQCVAFGKKCSNCGKFNHFHSVCRSNKACNFVNDDDVMHIETFPENHSSARLLFKLDGKSVEMEVDTGAAATIISEKMWRQLGSPELSESNRAFTAYDGHRMKPIGELSACLQYDDDAVQACVTVVASSKSYGLLGRDLLSHFKFSAAGMEDINSAAADTTVEPLPAMKIDPVTIDIDDPSKLKFVKARPVPLPMRDRVKQHLQHLEQQGIIKPVTSSRYASPVVWVRKRNGDLRMCADFKVHVNQAVKSDAFPMPSTETIFTGLDKSRVFAKLDLTDAYSQVPLNKASREVCTINTVNGLYELTRLPKGMKNSSALFQRAMESILKDIPGVIIYQDDILVHAETSDQLARRVTSVLRRFEEKNVAINKSKSVLNSSKIRFLGHLLTPEGVRPDPDILSKILSCSPPQNRHELESFLGLINYFGRMVPQFSDLVSPLHRLRKKDVEFVWDKTAQASFDSILRILGEPPLLRPYSLQKEVTLTTDASERAIGGVLTQEGHPVMYVSRALTPAEGRYSNIEREALSIVWCCLRLSQLLLGRRFTLVTDHRPLIRIYGGASLPKVASSRITRWAILLQRFDFDIRYKAGNLIAHADALTRLKIRSDECHAEDFVINGVYEENVTKDIMCRAKSLIPNDEVALRVMERVEAADWRNVRMGERPFFRARKQLRVENALLFMGDRLYLPTSMRKDAFCAAHELHTGYKATYERLRQTVWWPGMFRNVRDWVLSCSLCSTARPRLPPKTEASWPRGLPFQRIHADWCHVPGEGNLLLLVDAESGWIEATLLKERTTEKVISCLSTLCSRFGVPKTLVSDNGPEFTSEALNQWCARNGIVKVESPPYHQQSNGVAERGVQTIKRSLAAWRLELVHLPFAEYLKRVLLHHRACFRRRDGRTPAEVVFGRNLRVPLTSKFAFGEAVNVRAGNKGMRPASFLMERSNHTAFVIDTETSKLRLAHDEQLAPSGQPPDPPLCASSPAVSREVSALPTPASHDQPSVSPASEDTLPMIADNEPTVPARPRRIIKQRRVLDYNDL